MKLSSRVLFACGLVVSSPWLADRAAAEGPAAAPLMLTPDDLTWVDAAPSLPAGAQLAVVEGDPAQAGPFVLRLRLPADYRIASHTHGGAAERITVLSGTFYLGLGEQPDPDQARAFPAGSYLHLPPTSPHYAFTRGEVVVQVQSVGPWEVDYLSPQDAPAAAE